MSKMIWEETGTLIRMPALHGKSNLNLPLKDEEEFETLRKDKLSRQRIAQEHKVKGIQKET